MALFNEAQLEQSIIQLFLEQGYEYAPGATVGGRRGDGDVLMRDEIRHYLRDRYKAEHITDNEIDRIIRRLEQDGGGNLYEENKGVMGLLTDGFSLKRDDATLPNLYVYPVSFDEKNFHHNRFHIVNQLEIQGIDKKRIPDGIVFVNGLPLVVLEFKNAIKENTTIEDAYKLLTIRYRRDIPQLFRYNAFVVISDGVNNKFGSLFADYDFFTSLAKGGAAGTPHRRHTITKDNGGRTFQQRKVCGCAAQLRLHARQHKIGDEGGMPLSAVLCREGVV